MARPLALGAGLKAVKRSWGWSLVDDGPLGPETVCNVIWYTPSREYVISDVGTSAMLNERRLLCMLKFVAELNDKQ